MFTKCLRAYGLMSLCYIALAAAWQSPARAVTLNPGDIVITADLGFDSLGENYGLVEIDPTTGNRTIISDDTHGSGPQMSIGFKNDVTRAPGGDLLVAAQNGIFSVDPSTGDRTLFSSTPATDVAIYGGQIFAVDGSQLLNIDPTTGNATLLTTVFTNSSVGLTIESGTIYVGTQVGVFGFSTTGALVSHPDALDAANTISLLPYGNGTLLVGGAGDLGFNGIKIYTPSVDGYQTVSSSLRGTGRGISNSVGLGLAANGTIWDASAIGQSSSILAIDPTTGNRTILSDATHGLGPSFGTPAGLVVVPEPCSAVLVILAVVELIARERRRR